MTNDLERAGDRLRRARAELKQANQQARDAAIAAHARDDNESETARILGVDRKTVRRWTGKQR